MGLDVASILSVARLSVSHTGSGERGHLYEVKGETFPLRHVLADLGGRWDGAAAAWIFEGEDPSEKIAAILDSPEHRGLVAEIAAQPHYIGHRQRLRERALADMAALPDYELVELLLFSFFRQKDTKPLAKALLQRFGSLGALLAADPRQLAGVEGMNQQAIAGLKAIAECLHRIAREEAKESPELGSFSRMLAYCRMTMAHHPVECFRILYLNRKNILISDEVVQTGTINGVPVYPREVVKHALNRGAAAIILCHNHPSGDPTPSLEDFTMTEQVIEACKAVGIEVHDHVIIGRNGHVSFRQSRLMGLGSAKPARRAQRKAVGAPAQAAEPETDLAWDTDYDQAPSSGWRVRIMRVLGRARHWR